VTRKKAAEISNAFLAERVRALAIMYLTRRDDLQVAPADRQLGIEFLVRILRKEDPSVRQFGVALRGSVEALTADHAGKALGTALQRFSQVAEYPYPVCLFYFTMENDEGHYVWVAEPVLGEEGSPGLRVHSEPDITRLTTSAIDEIVARVNRWYDAFYARIVMADGREDMADGLKLLHRIIDREAEYFEAHGRPPQRLILPVRLAYDIAKLGREHLGELSGLILKEGVQVLEREKLLGMEVKLVRAGEDFRVE
jgi:hypothetical protein